MIAEEKALLFGEEDAQKEHEVDLQAFQATYVKISAELRPH